MLNGKFLEIQARLDKKKHFPGFLDFCEVGADLRVAAAALRTANQFKLNQKKCVGRSHVRGVTVKIDKNSLGVTQSAAGGA
jgi:hypothetical protein